MYAFTNRSHAYLNALLIAISVISAGIEFKQVIIIEIQNSLNVIGKVK